MQSPILVIGSKEKEEKEKEKKEEEVEKNLQIAFKLLKGLPRPSG